MNNNALVGIDMATVDSEFESWWESDGQYCRSGGGDYEKTFAYRAYEAATAKANLFYVPMVSGFTVVDMTSAETASYRGLAEHLIERLATAYPDSETTMTVECFADWLSKEFKR